MNTKSHDSIESPDDLERRLQSLSGLVEDNPQFVQKVLSRIETEDAGPSDIHSFWIGKWVMRSAIGIAAAGLIAVMVWSLWATSPRRAFAMEEVSKRVLSLASLYVKGTIYPPDGGPGRTIEIFAQQPGHCRINGRIDADNASTDLIITPEKTITMNPATKTATIVPANPEDAKTQVDQVLQSQLLFGSSRPGFEKLRSEDLHGVETDLYENRLDSMRLDIWLNPATGLPVQTEMYQFGPGKPDQLLVRFDTIQADPALPADIFTPIFGAGWMVREAKAQPDVDSLSRRSIRFGNMCLSMRYEVSLGNGDVLICWCLFDPKDPGNDLNLPSATTTLTFKAQGGTSYTEHLLHADATPNGFHWRWSLLHPNKAPSEAVILAVNAKTGHASGQFADFPITYPPQQLAEEVQAMQRQTLPKGQAPMTLEQIEATLRK